MAIVWIILSLCACVHLASGEIVNVARGKPTNVSSQWSSYLDFGPFKAVDGDTNAVDPGGSVITTNTGQQYGAWWVDLETQVQDPTVKIYFRTGFEIRRNSVQVFTSATPFTMLPPSDHPCYTTSASYRAVEDIVTFTNCSGTWRYLMVYREAGDSVLDFGEVEIWGCNGTYGENCDRSCDSRQCAVTPTSCNRNTGACPPGGCKSGWLGADCTHKCVSSMYGPGCKQPCTNRKCKNPSSPCYHVTGVCEGGCQAGWNGTDCTQKCISGSYGDNCNKLCSRRNCQTPSPICDHVTGVCQGGCEAGWNGTDCMAGCIQGTYGSNCVKSCSDRNCKNSSSSCARDTGQCQDGCLDGWQGEDCTSECPPGTFGTSCFSCSIRHCQGEVGCSGDGTCSSGCQNGWRLSNCTMACPNGTFGPGCNSYCGNCTGVDICNHTTGDCPNGCRAGWRGNQCKEMCTDNTYGVNCGETCGYCAGTCDKTDGHCPDGCQEGYNGTKCQTNLFTADPNHSVVPAVAGTVAAVLVIVIIVIVIIVWKRRRSSQDNKPLGSQPNRALNVSDTYVNVATGDEKGDTRGKPVIKPKGNEKHPAQEKLKTKPKSPRQSGEPTADPDLDEEIQDEEDFSPSNDYYNVDDTEEVIREIPVRDLEKTIQKIRNRKGGFEAEYNRLPSGFTAPYDDSQKPENSGKNKFRGYYPYDHNRVHLSTIPDIPGSDYINASTMHSYDQRKTYIAAQAPNKKTVGDFWRMIWEQHCSRVVMLTGLVEGGKAKCYQYWPDDGTLNTDQFRVEVEVTDTRANYTVRHLKVASKDNGQRQSVVQYHYTSWPDHGVPDTLALVHFIWMIRQMHTHTDGPLLVHCSAGIGRTGTYIAVDSLLDQARSQGMVDIQGYVSVMRGQRKNMIQTKEQYECVFHCLVEMTKFGNTSMDVENFTTSYSNRGMDSVVDRKTIREITQMVVKEVRGDSPARHRMWVNGNEDFIVRVGPTLRQLRGYLQAVTPSPGLEKLLWKLVEDKNVNNVIVMSQVQKNVVGVKGSVKKYGDTVVTTMNQNNLSSDLTMTTVKLQMKDEGISRSIKLYDFNGAASLDSMSPLLLNHTHLHQLSSEITPVVIIHSESDRKCVVSLCIMGNILSGILEDRHVDVIGHVRTFLKCCPDVTFTEEDIERLYRFAQKCVETTGAANTYANL